VKEPYSIIKGVPIPETRGRKKGSVDLNHSARQAAIAKGVALVAQGHSCVEAATMVQSVYSGTSHNRMVRLIRQARKDSRQPQSS
jgi:transposase